MEAKTLILKTLKDVLDINPGIHPVLVPQWLTKGEPKLQDSTIYACHFLVLSSLIFLLSATFSHTTCKLQKLCFWMAERRRKRSFLVINNRVAATRELSLLSILVPLASATVSKKPVFAIVLAYNIHSKYQQLVFGEKGVCVCVKKIWCIRLGKAMVYVKEMHWCLWHCLLIENI